MDVRTRTVCRLLIPLVAVLVLALPARRWPRRPSNDNLSGAIPIGLDPEDPARQTNAEATEQTASP